MLHYEGLVVPQKGSNNPQTISTIHSLQTRVFCLRTDKSRDSDCLNISCSSCLFNENKNSVKFNKWYTEMKETFVQKRIATIH